MKIQQLFEELEKITKDKESVFEHSGMVNRFKEMKYGFFPLGWGILDENNKIDELPPTNEIEEGGVMVLGNDFGTLSYVNNYVGNPDKKIGETDSKTIKNLLNERVGIDKNKTFFTNFYLGVRTNKEATMTKRVEELQKKYKELCCNFFIKQIDLIKPRLIICLGHDVKNALNETFQLTKWKKTDSLKTLYEQQKYFVLIEKLGNIRFVIIPHPCDLRNFKNKHMDHLAIELTNN